MLVQWTNNNEFLVTMSRQIRHYVLYELPYQPTDRVIYEDYFGPSKLDDNVSGFYKYVNVIFHFCHICLHSRLKH